MKSKERKSKGKSASQADAAKAEALDQGVKFEFDGKDYELAPADQWDIDVIEFMMSGGKGVEMNEITFVKELLGPDNYAKFRTDDEGNRVKRDSHDLGDILAVIMESIGAEQGE